MAISRANTDSDISENQPSAPGRRLREARLARKLDIEEVAARLHLHVRTIERIEADDYENLPAPTFIRGYLRGYARMLDMAPEPVVESYNSHEFAPPPLVRDISRSEELRSTDFPFRLATYLILGVVVILSAIWWQNQYSSSPSSGSETLELAPRPDPETARTSEIRTRTEVVEADDALRATAAASAVEAATESQSDEPALVPTSAASEGSVEVEPVLATAGTQAFDSIEPSPVDTEEPTMGTAVGAAGAEALATEVLEDAPPQEGVVAQAEVEQSTVESTTPTASADDTAPAARNGTDSVRITFGLESWVEVYDGKDSTLFYDLARPGTSIELEGNAPFRVLLGNASEVRVEFNGDVFDISPHTNAGIARFTLDSTRASANARQPELQNSQNQ